MRIALFCIFSLLVITTCTKKDNIENNGLLGKWKLKEEFRSPGAGGQWYKVAENEQSVIEFLSDGTFIFSANFKKADLQLNRYQIVGNELNMLSTVNNNTDKWYINYLNNKKLELSIVACFEGCPYRFVPVW